MKMTTTDAYTNEVLMKAQELLWGGSETENIEAHNMIAKLINDRVGLNSQGQEFCLTGKFNKLLENY